MNLYEFTNSANECVQGFPFPYLVIGDVVSIPYYIHPVVIGDVFSIPNYIPPVEYWKLFIDILIGLTVIYIVAVCLNKYINSGKWKLINRNNLMFLPIFCWWTVIVIDIMIAVYIYLNTDSFVIGKRICYGFPFSFLIHDFSIIPTPVDGMFILKNLVGNILIGVILAISFTYAFNRFVLRKSDASLSK
jgi:hypothetical protein